MTKARIFDIYRGTTHDGPGLRSTVFFAGCPLHCSWCHNPEGIPTANQVWWQEKSCIGCELCLQACPHGAKIATPEGILTATHCARCGACVLACPTGATSFVWKEWELDELIKEVSRDKAYYERTGGGVTASGGECMLQADFLNEFFSELHRRGISTALDTCGEISWEHFERILPHTDIVLYDLKLMNNELHRKYTGVDNSRILENLRRLSLYAEQTNLRLWIRTPLIPGATASQENLQAAAEFIVHELKGTVERWELCAFNNHCLSKYERLHLSWKYAQTKLLSQDEVRRLRQTALACGLGDDHVVVTGMLTE